MKSIIFVLFLLVFCTGIGFSNAELYEWEDQDGVVHFSNSEVEVPPDTPVETEKEIPHDPTADAKSKKHEKKSPDAEVSAMPTEPKQAVKSVEKPTTPSHYEVYRDHDVLREKAVRDTKRQEQSEHKNHPEIPHEHEAHH